MIKLRGTWTRIDPTETNWQCEYGHDGWDLSCNTCNESSDKSSYPDKRNRMNRAHWQNRGDANYLCDFHYSMLTYAPPPVNLELPTADEFASAFDAK